MNLYTIGFTQKTAEKFFGQLRNNNIRTLIDIRLNNKSQLAGFTKGADLKYFLKEICNIEYVHDTYLSPTEEILKDYKNKKISWDEYETKFKELMQHRGIDKYFSDKYLKNDSSICLLCSEATPEHCHRRLLAEMIAQNYPEITIKHI